MIKILIPSFTILVDDKFVMNICEDIHPMERQKCRINEKKINKKFSITSKRLHR